MKFYSVSVLATKNDNGTATTFKTRQEAEAFQKWAREQGCYFVSAIW